MNAVQQPPVLIIGAGKIARGYVGHLVALSGAPLIFVDVNEQVVRLLNERGQYTVHILGNPAKSTTVTNLSALHASDPRVADAVVQARVVFVSVGGPNLPAVAATLAAGLSARRAAGGQLLNIVCCENWRLPADLLRRSLAERLPPDDQAYLASKVGIAEATVLRSCIEPTEAQRTSDPLAVQAQDYWELQIDAAALVEPLPPIAGLFPVEKFYASLERKLFTYNAGNAVIGYLGALRGHEYLYQAATDPVILEVAQGVYDESGAAICAKHGYTREEQAAFAQQSLRKYQDPKIVDPVERQVRDPLRKLSRYDRLIGPASLALEYGIRPVSLALAIAAALHYTNPQDPAAVKLQTMLANDGLDAVLETVCGIDPHGELAALIKQRMPDVAAFVKPA
jgi:mannitol-1-phosphate 5-dehydrogenase